MRILNTPTFDRELKYLAKRHRSLLNDITQLAQSLTITPYQGESLGRNCYKVRMAISSKGKGKSGGARIITCIKIEHESLYMLTIYDKNDRDSITDTELAELLKEIEA
jgi:hypothetical protein